MSRLHDAAVYYDLDMAMHRIALDPGLCDAEMRELTPEQLAIFTKGCTCELPTKPETPQMGSQSPSR